MAKDIKVKNGAVVVKINGAFSPEELRELLKELCEAHAKATPGGRDPDGRPQFVVANKGTIGTLVQVRAPDRVRLAVLSAFFGWCGGEMSAADAEQIADGLVVAANQVHAMGTIGKPSDDQTTH